MKNPPKKQVSAIKYEQMLKVAGKMFIEKGFDAVSMDAVAEAVPVSKRTLYNHFKDKNTLFVSVMQSRCGSIAEALEQSIQEGKDIEITLKNIGKKFLDTVLEPDSVNMYRTIITKSQQFKELGKLFYESGPKRSRTLLATYFTKLSNNGEFEVSNPELSANMFISMLLNRVQMQCLLGQRDVVHEKEKQEIIDYAVKIFLCGHKN